MNYLDDLAARIRAEVPPGDLPHDDTKALFRLYAVLLLAKGEDTTAADVHNVWSAWMADRQGEHESLVPFDELPPGLVAEDAPYVAAIKTVARSRAGGLFIDPYLFPAGLPDTEEGRNRMFELYKIMVASSEGLVARCQGVNTFFLTINGAVVTAAGLVLGSGGHNRVEAAGLLVLTVAGAILAQAWISLINSFGQLNTGKFAVINRLEREFPAAIYLAEWKALGEGKNRKKYATFTSHEVWVPRAFLAVYSLAAVLELFVVAGWWRPG